MAKNKKIRTKIMLIFAAIVLLQAFLFMPVPYYLEMPDLLKAFLTILKLTVKKTSKRENTCWSTFQYVRHPRQVF